VKFFLLLIIGSYLFVGCAGIQDVKPWEKENHSRAIMSFSGLHPEVNKFEGHIYFSKEASRGGSGVAGGGCGCN